MTKEELKEFSAEVASKWEQGEFRVPIHLAGGNEEELISVFEHIKGEDYVFSTHRNMYHALLHGVSKEDLLAAYRQDSAGPLGGCGGCMCVIDTDRRFFSSGIVGGSVAIAVGVAYALKDSRREEKVWCFVGDGAVDTGHFWEGLRYAVAQDLPITFVIEDNDRSVDTSIKERWGEKEELMHGDTNKPLISYKYTPTYPHCGTGKFVQF